MGKGGRARGKGGKGTRGSSHAFCFGNLGSPACHGHQHSVGGLGEMSRPCPCCV